MATTLYETDFNLWIEQTVNQLKNGQIQDLDLENLIEEVQSMGSNDKREIKSRLIVLIMHLLKCNPHSARSNQFLNNFIILTA